jgi:hypothetical protein
MRLSTILENEETEKGTFAGLRFSQDDEDVIIGIIEEMGVPNPIQRDEIHLTLLYSRKYLPNYEPATLTDMWAYPKGYHIFEGRNNKSILVILLESEDVTKRHLELMKQHKATYDFPEYRPHITLSYDIEDFMIMRNKKAVLVNIKEQYDKLLPKEFHISNEFVETLNTEWHPKKD